MTRPRSPVAWRRARIGATILVAIVFAPLAIAWLLARMKAEGLR